ncbi:MAG: class I SAM-dependent methyltransferase, partial [Deltaproteobacteria bacterium]|nr:class I SAM-dependent methyltransferase [Deltaproteobacteria bacterium]
LKYKLPPGHTLELGSAHGAFVALLQWAGFQATGLEVDPWIVEFGQKTFQVPMLLGPIEKQTLPPHSLDIIFLFDVLEHLPDPEGTIRHCLPLLKNDGIFILQTQSFPEIAYADLKTQ